MISVNLPEPTDDKSEAHRAGLATVSAVTLARLSAVMKSVDGAETAGLRVFALGKSNFGDEQDADPKRLFDLSESTLGDRQHDMQAIAAEVLLKEGVALDAPWTRQEAGSASVVTAGGVAVVLSLDITDDVVHDAAALGARVVVFLEDGFAGADAVKANAVTNAKNLGITLKTV